MNTQTNIDPNQETEVHEPSLDDVTNEIDEKIQKYEIYESILNLHYKFEILLTHSNIAKNKVLFKEVKELLTILTILKNNFITMDDNKIQLLISKLTYQFNEIYNSLQKDKNGDSNPSDV